MSTTRNIILGVLPILSQHTVALHILSQTLGNAPQAPSQIYSASGLFKLNPVTAHPEQRGFRITMENLEGLPPWDCLYRFRYS